MTTSKEHTVLDLLAHGAWARRLAAGLVSDGEPADLLQETWIATGGNAPAAVPVRQWLAGVMRNLARMGRRSAQRRSERGRQYVALAGSEPSRPDELAEKLEVQRQLAGLVLALAPLYRDVVLLRFYDDLSTPEIAAKLGLPAGTVRRRLTIAMAELRGRLALDADEKGRDWRRVLALLVPGGWPKAGAPARIAPIAAPAAAFALAVAGFALFVHATPEPDGLVSGGREGQGGGGLPGGAPPRLLLAGLVPGLDPESSEMAAAASQDPALARAEAAERYKVPLGTGPIRGPADAKVTILEFVDYQCHFTARAERALGEVLARFANDVRFQVIHRPLAFHREAPLLARAALAADRQGQFWALHARLMGKTREAWTEELVVAEARALALDVPRFVVDLGHDEIKRRLAVDEATADSLGIDGVPAFFVNGRPLVGSDAPSKLPAVIAEEIARADRLLAAGAVRAHIYNAVTASGKDVALASTMARSSRTPPGEHSFESIFVKGGGCLPPLPAPTALDFSLSSGADGKPQMSAWGLAAAGHEHYQTYYYPDKAAVALRSQTARPNDFVAQHQTIVAKPYLGKEVRFRAEVKVDDVETWAGLFLRVEGEGERIVTSQRARIMPGDRGWHTAEVVVAVPADGRAISYGLILAGRGAAAMRKVGFDVVR